MFGLGKDFSQTIPGDAFRSEGQGRCAYDGKRRAGGIRGLRLDLRHGTWAVALKPSVELDGLVNPVEVSLAVGESEGSERILMSENGRVWRYRR
jgi:hypothetical protein